MPLAGHQPCQGLSVSVVVCSITIGKHRGGSHFVFLQVVGTEQQVQLQWGVARTFKV